MRVHHHPDDANTAHVTVGFGGLTIHLSSVKPTPYSGREVAVDLWARRQPLGAHIELTEKADLVCVAPATANLLGKMANGLADDLLSTLLLAFDGPVVLAPAMNTTMWEKPSVGRNVAVLHADGYHFVGPQEGWLSCRRSGIGRMAEPEDIKVAIEGLLKNT